MERGAPSRGEVLFSSFSGTLFRTFRSFLASLFALRGQRVTCQVSSEERAPEREEKSKALEGARVFGDDALERTMRLEHPHLVREQKRQRLARSCPEKSQRLSARQRRSAAPSHRDGRALARTSRRDDIATREKKRKGCFFVFDAFSLLDDEVE